MSLQPGSEKFSYIYNKDCFRQAYRSGKDWSWLRDIKSYKQWQKVRDTK